MNRQIKKRREMKNNNNEFRNNNLNKLYKLITNKWIY